MGSSFAVLGGNAVDPDIGRLEDVVVDRDDPREVLDRRRHVARHIAHHAAAHRHPTS